jgi:hypothetical protein
VEDENQDSIQLVENQKRVNTAQNQVMRSEILVENEKDCLRTSKHQ